MTFDQDGAIATFQCDGRLELVMALHPDVTPFRIRSVSLCEHCRGQCVLYFLFYMCSLRRRKIPELPFAANDSFMIPLPWKNLRPDFRCVYNCILPG